MAYDGPKYTKVRNDFLTAPGLKPVDKLVLLYLGSKVGEWDVNMRQISRDLGIGRHSADDALTRLRRAGWISRPGPARDDQGQWSTHPGRLLNRDRVVVGDVTGTPLSGNVSAGRTGTPVSGNNVSAGRTGTPLSDRVSAGRTGTPETGTPETGVSESGVSNKELSTKDSSNEERSSDTNETAQLGPSSARESDFASAPSSSYPPTTMNEELSGARPETGVPVTDYSDEPDLGRWLNQPRRERGGWRKAMGFEDNADPWAPDESKIAKTTACHSDDLETPGDAPKITLDAGCIKNDQDLPRCPGCGIVMPTGFHKCPAETETSNRTRL